MDYILEQFNPTLPFDISDTDLSECCNVCTAITRMTEDGFMVCSNPICGTVSIHVIDDAPEWRFYEESSTNPTRCGLPTNPLYLNLPTDAK